MTPKQLDCTVHPPKTAHTHTIIFLHGRGDTANNFSQSINYSTSSQNLTLEQHFPTIRWVFPSSNLRAGARFPNAPTSQWFDTWNVANLSHREELQMPGLGESVASIRTIVEREVSLLDGRWDHLILAGISQGGAVAMHTLLNLNPAAGSSSEPRPRLGGVMGFSCRFPFPGRTLAETREIVGLENVPEDNWLVENTPVLIEHCTNDPLVKVDTGRQVRDTLRRFGASVTWQEYPMGGHWLKSPDGIDDAVLWLKEHVSRLREYVVGGTEDGQLSSGSGKETSVT